MEPIRNLFAALFLSSIGMLIHVHFLWSHVDILLASVILVIVIKTAVGTLVTKAFRYSAKTSFLVSWLNLIILQTFIMEKLYRRKVILQVQLLFLGWNIACSNRRICLCSSKPCFKSSSYRGNPFLSFPSRPLLPPSILSLIIGWGHNLS